jgi:hypothetical protein
MLPPALRYLPQHGRYEHAVSFAAGVRAGGWRGAGERAFGGISATNTLLNPLMDCFAKQNNKLYIARRAVRLTPDFMTCSKRFVHIQAIAANTLFAQ